MYLAVEHRLIFHACPRTGSRAIAKAMREELGAVRVGSHHTSLPIDPLRESGWTVFCVVRPHHEVIASFYGPNVGLSEVEHFKERWCKEESLGVTGSALYWRANMCTEVLQYPDLRIPGYDIHVKVIGQTGRGKAWRTMLKPEIIAAIRNHTPWAKEYEYYGWQLPEV